MNVSHIKHWPSMTFRDVDAMTDWLSTIGFREHATYRDDSGAVVHAEWVWDGGGIMFGVARDDAFATEPGASSAYLVVEDPDDVVERAVAAGASVVQAVKDQDYGGRGGSVRDPEGNVWSFGSYQPG